MSKSETVKGRGLRDVWHGVYYSNMNVTEVTHLASKGQVADKISGEESCPVCSLFSLIIRMELFWANIGIYD